QHATAGGAAGSKERGDVVGARPLKGAAGRGGVRPSLAGRCHVRPRAWLAAGVFGPGSTLTRPCSGQGLPRRGRARARVHLVAAGAPFGLRKLPEATIACARRTLVRRNVALQAIVVGVDHDQAAAIVDDQAFGTSELAWVATARAPLEQRQAGR